MSAHERAVDRLAGLLRGTYAMGPTCSVAETIDAGLRRLAEGPPEGLAGWRARAAVVLRELGLVAVDPALVERVREARGKAERRCRHDDPDEQCDRCRMWEVLTIPQADARRMDRALADSILAQLEPLR